MSDMPLNVLRAHVLTKVNDELNDLETSNPFLPPDADSTSALEVVPVHHNVNSEVESDWDPGNGRQPDQLGVAEESSGTMVVGVQEGQGLLLEKQEDGIEQFQVLCEVIELYQVSIERLPGPVFKTRPHT